MNEAKAYDLDSLSSIIINMSKNHHSELADTNGCVFFVKSDSKEKISNLALKVADSLHENGKAPVYYIPGDAIGDYAWPYSRIKKSYRLLLTESGSIVVQGGGIIFPQSYPIVLLIENFNCLSPRDQLCYARLVEWGSRQVNENENVLCKGSVIIGGLIQGSSGKLDIGASSRGCFLTLK